MKKILLFAFLLLIFPLSAHAHAGLSSSTPAEGETLEESPAEIQFQFDSAIQQGEMTLTDESGHTVEISDISFSEMELIGQLGEELPDGAYIADWRVISQDGHEITGTLTFNVAAEAIEEETAEVTTESTETTEEAAEAVSATDEQAEGAAASVDGPGFSMSTIIIIAIVAIAAIAFFVVARRK